MMKHVIHIFGASGSGTSTLGRAIADRTGYVFLDSDDYLWLPTDPNYTTKRLAEERLALLERDIDASHGAVVSGSLVGWGDPLMDRFTLAVRLVVPQDIRMARLERRELNRYGDRIRPGGDMYETSQAFLAWAAAYEDGPVTMRSRTMHDLWQQKLTCPLLILDGTRPMEELVEPVLRESR